MSITPYNNFTVRDLSNVQQSYVNSITEVGYFSGRNLGTIANGLWRSLPAVLNTNNGIARLDSSGGLILDSGIYKINLSLFPITTQVGRSNISFNFGTRYLVNDPSTNIVNAFGGVQPIGMFTYDPSNNPYSPGIISWLSEGYDSSNNTISNFIKNPNSHELSYNYNNAGYPNGTLYGSNCTTKMSFVLDSSASIYFNVSTNSTTGVTMGNSCFTLSLISSPFTVPVKTWRWAVSDASSGNWYSIASSSDGKYLAAVTGEPWGSITGNMYTSSNYGANWITRSSAGTKIWTCVASSASGQYLAATVFNEGVFLSSDYGLSWSQPTDALLKGGKRWLDIKISRNGSQLATGSIDSAGNYVSTNFGVTWRKLTVPTTGNYISMSESMQYYTISRDFSVLYASTNDGITWTPSTTYNGTWTQTIASIDGKYVFACAGNRDLHRSDDYGVTMLPNNTVNGFYIRGIAVSSNGQYVALAGVSGLNVRTSSDYGKTFQPQTLPSGTNNLQCIASSSDGTRLVAGRYGGAIIIGVYS